jgi:hypothetical protein
MYASLWGGLIWNRPMPGWQDALAKSRPRAYCPRLAGSGNCQGPPVLTRQTGKPAVAPDCEGV